MGAVRLFLALVVVFDHVRAIVMRGIGLDVNVLWALGFNAGFAVMFFYIISGFLISYGLNEKYGFAGPGVSAFYRSRFIRIFSLYWPIAGFILWYLPGARQQFLQGSWLDQWTGLGLFGIDWSICFSDYPQEHWQAAIPALMQAWSLGAELTFYLLAPLVLRSRVAIATVLGISALLRTVAVHKFGFDAIWTYHFFPATVLFFMLGAGIDDAARAFPLLRSRLPLAAIALCPVVLIFPHYSGWDTWQFWAAVLLFVAGLPALFQATKDSPVLNFFGNLSYPVYLVHGIVIVVLVERGLSGWAVEAGGAYGLMALGIGTAIAAAIAAHYVFERPVAALLWMVSRRWWPAAAVARPAT